MTKLKLAAWVILLLMLSAMSGFLTVLVQDPTAPREDYPLMALIGAIAVMIIVGIIGLIPFFVLRRFILEVRLKRSFQVYTFFCLAMITSAYFKFPKAIETRDRHEFFRYYEPDIRTALEYRVDIECEKDKDIHLSASDKTDVIDITLLSLQTDDRLIDKMISSGNIEEFILNNPQVKQEILSTIDWKVNSDH